MPALLLPDIASRRVDTPRLTQRILYAEDADPAGQAEAVLFVHGNHCAALFWQQSLLALAETGRAPGVAVDLRGYGQTDPPRWRLRSKRRHDRRAPSQ
jgi:pimeloyl-ACP methyl ester carboxylesterase